MMKTDIFWTKTTKPICNIVNHEIIEKCEFIPEKMQGNKTQVNSFSTQKVYDLKQFDSSIPTLYMLMEERLSYFLVYMSTYIYNRIE